MNLQTLAFIQTIENLLHDVRISETEEEDELLSYFREINELLNQTFFVDTNEVAERSHIIKNLDVSFHKLYRKLMVAFQIVQDIFLQISPGIQLVNAYSLPSVKDLVGLYANKSMTLQKSLYM